MSTKVHRTLNMGRNNTVFNKVKQCIVISMNVMKVICELTFCLILTGTVSQNAWQFHYLNFNQIQVRSLVKIQILTDVHPFIYIDGKMTFKGLIFFYSLLYYVLMMSKTAGCHWKRLHVHVDTYGLTIFPYFEMMHVTFREHCVLIVEQVQSSSRLEELKLG